MTTSVGPNPTVDIGSFIQTVFTVKLAPNLNNADANGDFSTMADIIAHSSQTDTGDGISVLNITNDPQITEILTSTNSAVPTYFFSKGKCRDTSIGGNDAINCYPQFNETDDVAEHPFLSTSTSDPDGITGMGRVYSEMYDDQQQIMYLTFGVPQFNNLHSFYSNAIFSNLAKVMNNGGQTTAGEIGTLIGEGAVVFLSLPVLPLVFIYNALNKISDVSITKYYDFKSAMPLYYRITNSMINHLAVNMGLTRDSFFLDDKGTNAAGGAVNTDQTLMQKDASGNNSNSDISVSTSGIPTVFQEYGFDVYKIMLKKYSFSNVDVSAEHTSDYTLTNTVDDGTGTDAAVNAGQTQATGSLNFSSRFISAFTNQLYEATLYVGFRIEKGIDTSETFTNTTGQSSIAQTVNSQIQSTRDSKFTAENSDIGNIMSAIGGVVSGAANAVSWGGLGNIGDILAGNGMIDFPDVWKDSSFSKNYSFNMSLRSPYGDPISILQNLYFPLALLLSGALPRAVGQASYTSPFVCRAYCKGMFAIPLGMITSITVKRGADQFGWSTQRLPTCLDISFEIKDLSPAMYMGITDNGSILTALQEIFSTNSNYQEYLMTLSGMGLQERILNLRNIRRKAAYLFSQLNTTKLSPFYIGSVFGNSLPARVITNFAPVTKLPNN